MSIDLFQPRTMAAALEVMKPSKAFLRNLFFSAVQTYLTEKIDVDAVVHARRLAPFVNPLGTGGKPTDRIGFSSSTVTPPLVAPKRAMTIPDMQTRLPGEHIYSGRSPEERTAAILGADLADLDQMIARREEWMCAKALFDSSIDIVGDDVNYTISFARDSTLSIGTLAGADAWTHASCDIYKQFRTWRRLIAQLGATATDMVCSPEAIDAFITSPKILGTSTGGGILGVLRADFGSLSPQLQGDTGATYWGMLAGTNIRIWSYDEWFIDPADGVEKPIVPAKKILLGCKDARTEMRYGAVAISDVAAGAIGVVEGKRVPWSKVTDEPPVRWLKLSSRPLPVPIHNVFLTAQVVA